MTFRRRLRAFAATLKQDNDATVLIEAAAALPFLMVMAFGSMEYIRYITAHGKVSQLALQVADNTSRTRIATQLAKPPIREVDVNDAFEAVRLQGGSLDFENKGRIILSSLEYIPSTKQQWIHWQRCFGKGSYSSSYGVEGTKNTTGMGPAGRQIRATDGVGVMFVEIVYPYETFMPGNWMPASAKLIRYTASFQVRDMRDFDKIYNPSPAAKVSSCGTPSGGGGGGGGGGDDD